MTVIIPQIGQHLQTNVIIPSIQCNFSVEQAIYAPIDVVWSLVRQFDNPKAYKMFINSSTSRCSSTNTIGSIRNINHTSGFPSTTSVERLDELNDDKHVMVVSLVAGDHSRRFTNYQGTISVVEEAKEKGGDQMRTIVTEEYTVDVPRGSNEEETRFLVDTLVGFNLRSLAHIAERVINY